MKVAPLITVALILCIAFLSPIQAKKKPKPKPNKFCVGKDGNRYEVGKGYNDNEGKVCVQYKCVKKKKKLVMKKGKCISLTVDGEWSNWSDWSACTSTCGDAIKTRKRTCSSPPPSDDGSPCPGMKEEIEECSLPSCGSVENVNVTALELNVQSLNDSMQTLQTTMQSILELITTMQYTANKQGTCLSDLSSSDCPTSAAGKVGVVDGIAANTVGVSTNADGLASSNAGIATNKAGISSNKNGITSNTDTCSSIQATATKLETCLGDVNSGNCPSSKGGKTSVSDAIMENKDAIVAHHPSQTATWEQIKSDDCWSDCGEKGGPCTSFCGSDGYCCRKGYDGCPPGAAEASPDHHTCVKANGGSTMQTTTLASTTVSTITPAGGSTMQATTLAPTTVSTITPSGSVLLHTDANYDYYKVPVPASSMMSSAVVERTCLANGMTPQCLEASYADHKCVQAPSNPPYGLHPRAISKILCDTIYPEDCASTLNMFWYTIDSWHSGSACGATKYGQFCSTGKDYTSTSDMQYFAACLKPVTTDTASTTTTMTTTTPTTTGWTIIQRRGQFGNAEDYFYKDFNDYENGFGSDDGELWIGLKNLSDLTKDGEWELQVDLTDWDDTKWHAKYSSFSVGPAPTYQLHVGGFDDGESTLGDSLAFHNGAVFSARDKDQEGNGCPAKYKGGWWYINCFDTNLNGINFAQQKTDWEGIHWRQEKSGRDNDRKTRKGSVMKIRRVKATTTTTTMITTTDTVTMTSTTTTTTIATNAITTTGATESGFEGCVKKWCPQSGTNQQYTRCEEARDGGFTCVNPQIKYGATEGGIPGLIGTSSILSAWCNQLNQVFPQAQYGLIGSMTTGKRDCSAPKGGLYWCSGYDENGSKWCDIWDASWRDSTLDYHKESMNSVTALTCFPNEVK